MAQALPSPFVAPGPPPALLGGYTPRSSGFLPLKVTPSVGAAHGGQEYPDWISQILVMAFLDIQPPAGFTFARAG
ncbi:Uncharacterised protein [Mycobacteroides abscessus subsp. abscessus]|nr:Uncharacterised protein [Mycobacteroides abscessus subsp. abscessus]